MGTLQILVFVVVLVACSVPLGAHFARVLQGERTMFGSALGWLERGLLRLF
jgi:K+-transporting ATPase ATPase A chain